jgi:hypothetical protein
MDGDRRDDGDIGTQHVGRDGELAGQAHARLDHRETVADRVGAQHERHADGVVEVGLGRETLPAPNSAASSSSGPRLADAAGDAD